MEDRVQLTPELLVEDALIFGLRMNEGVDLAALRQRLPSAPWAQIEQLAARLVAEDLAVNTENRLRLTLRGRLVADAIGGEIMGAYELNSSE
jgi:oxygen-independent coproporphyrinogen-3 oxidase